MERISTDLAIIGAGAAGGALALFAAKSGIDCVLIDKKSFPRFKPCGCGITNRAASIIGTELPTQPASLIEFYSNNFNCSTPSPVSFGFRDTIDNHICKEAVKKGVLFFENERGQKIVPALSRITIFTEKHEICCKWLALSTGATDPLPHSVGFQKPYSIPAIEEELELHEADTIYRHPRFDFDVVKGGYAWCFPKANMVSVGILTTAKKVNLFSTLKDYKLKIGISKLKQVRIGGHPIPSRPVDKFAIGNTFVVGDAAGLVDPLTFEGVFYSYKSAQILSETLDMCKTNPSAACKLYSNRLRNEILPELKAAFYLSKVTYSFERPRAFLFKRYGYEFVKIITDIFNGKKSYRKELFKPSNYIQLFLNRL